jgi:Cu+-exporting ATPase
MLQVGRLRHVATRVGFHGNVVGIPLAALGYLSPVVAGAAMALSSVSVLANALLLSRWRPR